MQGFPSGARRRHLLGLLAAAPARRGAAAARADGSHLAWAAFRDQFVAPEGRVVDTGNDDISHSEGQGWALLMALHADDRPAFEQVLGWTRRVLQRPGDMLHAWRFRPKAATPVDDPNNASDGDLCIAWALLLAGERWGRADHAALGAAIARDILGLVVRRAGSHSVLLPGVQGFERPGGTVLNPSYYVFPAIAAMARAVPDPAWARLAADGLLLLRRARFGRWGLPPDWLHLDHATGAVSPAEGWPPRFSFDAVRVPLWLAWAGLDEEPVLRRAHEFWTAAEPPYLPAWADLTTDAVSSYPGSAGVAAIARLAGSGSEIHPEKLRSTPDFMQDSYYSAALRVLSCMAADSRATGGG